MEASLLPSDFPPLVSSAGGVSPPPPCNWLAAFALDELASSDFHLSHFPSEPEIIHFSGDKLNKGAEDWSLCLLPLMPPSKCLLLRLTILHLCEWIKDIVILCEVPSSC
ncbi:hypothetical protein KFK09_025313 [Dendrobium nobile]|uniref:Uncharacterized protein n=1 Tax=Dendrobium nobile TaxID=94219 RepID=A0A8T3AGI1_DENNO|nr:hypothetical protein KFK09_025313 [Dendrobium nobile]